MECTKEYKDALKRGVKIQIATEEGKTEKAVYKIVQTFKKNPAFQVKYFPLPPPEAVVSIVDKKEALVSTSSSANLEEAPALWSNNTCFIAVMQNYLKTNGTQQFK
jgi:hypothetical protein